MDLIRCYDDNTTAGKTQKSLIEKLLNWKMFEYEFTSMLAAYRNKVYYLMLSLWNIHHYRKKKKNNATQWQNNVMTIVYMTSLCSITKSLLYTLWFKSRITSWSLLTSVDHYEVPSKWPQWSNNTSLMYFSQCIMSINTKWHSCVNMLVLLARYKWRKIIASPLGQHYW